MMGRVLEGVVEQGKRLGRTLGFPTANIAPQRILGKWPPNGVYAAAIWLPGETGARLCMLDQGTHPTAPEGKPTVEAHLLDYRGDLYGLPVRVEYLRFLRPERRFPSLEALRGQLNLDRDAVRGFLQDALAGADGPGAARAREIEWIGLPGPQA